MLASQILVVMIFAAALEANAEKNPKPPKPPPAPKAHPNSKPGGGPAAQRKADEQIDKLAKMSPAQREQVLSQLPPNRRARVEAGLDRWNTLTPEAKARVEKLHSLPPEQQQRIRQLSQQIQALPQDRKVAVRRELARLRNMPESERQKRLNSAAVQKNFSPEELEILKESPALLPENYY